ncbi:MAG: DMT family transporter [Ruminococcaceae bacterium]|nr:DMT family transporter [Oscillospiraceae bacterium]
MRKQNIFAILAAVIWGTAFVAQKVGAESVPPLTFNAIRSLMAVVVLAIISFIMLKMERKKGTYEPVNHKKLILGGFLCGLFLTLATAFQQASLSEESAGKAGFVTALYIVIVPILGLFLKKKVPIVVWLGVLLAVCGLYFLCVTDGFVFAKSDIYLIMCALMFAIQIMFVDYFVSFVNGVLLSLVQFITMTILSSGAALIFEEVSFVAIKEAAFPLLYLGIFSSGIAYTLQILAQKDSNPAVVSLLMSLESVFSVIASALLLHSWLNTRETFGCLLMLVAVILAQIPPSFFKRKTKNSAQ